MFPEATQLVRPEEWQPGGSLFGVDPCTRDASRHGAGQVSRRVVSVDFETYYATGYSVAELGDWAYCHDPRFHASLVAVSDGVQTCVCRPEDFPWASINGMLWVSHNRGFDKAVFDRLVEVGVIGRDGARPSKWHCTAALCAYLQLPRNLEGAVREVFGITIDKGLRRQLKGVDLRVELLGVNQELLRYAATDAEACLGLWVQLEHGWPDHERRLFELTENMGACGLAMDWDYIASRKRDLQEIVDSLAAALPWSPPLSIKEFRLACDAAGVAPPKSTSASDTDFMRWLRENIRSDAATWVRHMQRIRSANRTAKVLESMELRRIERSECRSQRRDVDVEPQIDADERRFGRMAYQLKYCGASTARWSGGGGLNMQNLNRKQAEGVDLRRAIVAPPGMKLAVVDYSQIESRVLLFLAGDLETLEMFRANPDVDAYEVHARRTMGWRAPDFGRAAPLRRGDSAAPASESETLKAYCERTGSNLRQLAKARVLGLGFSCGAKRFIEVAKVMAGLDLSYPESDRIVKEYRESNPKVVELWSRLGDACTSCEGGNYVLPLPCTQVRPELMRYLIYRDIAFDDDGILCTVNGERTRIYGGLLAENWTQATARDVLASAWLRCAAAGYVPVLSVHDELVFEVPEGTAERDLATIIEIMEQPLGWAAGLPLKCDGDLMDHYRK